MSVAMGGHNARIGPCMIHPGFRGRRPADKKRSPWPPPLWHQELRHHQEGPQVAGGSPGIDTASTTTAPTAWLPEQLDSWLERLGWEALLNTRGTTFRALPDEARQDLDTAKARPCCWNT